MCFFPRQNTQFNKKAYKKGIHEYKCGYCPECLADKSRVWALRCVAEAKYNPGMMLTLTYDTYKRDDKGNIIGENLNLCGVHKEDCQKFIKRLRYYYPNNDIKYMIAAEFGTRTGRPHYHALIFGLQFDDCVPYKKSKRGNMIYRSSTLEKIWNNGICTVDSLNLSASTARYCTKYCAKLGGVNDTFMLFSQGIGKKWLMDNFNGKSYWIDGREYSIPRFIWNEYIEKKYDMQGYSRYVNGFNEDKYKKIAFGLQTKKVRVMLDLLSVYSKAIYIKRIKLHKARMELLSYAMKALYKGGKYVKMYRLRVLRVDRLCNELAMLIEKRDNSSFNYISKYNQYHDSHVMQIRRNSKKSARIRYMRASDRRDLFIFVRDTDTVYRRYLQYWQKKAEQIERKKPSAVERILALPNSKYFRYKQKALSAFNYEKCVPDLKQLRNKRGICGYLANIGKTIEYIDYAQLLRPPCHKGATDRRTLWEKAFYVIEKLNNSQIEVFFEKNDKNNEKISFEQLTFDNYV